MVKASSLQAPKKVRFSYSTADQPAFQRAVIQAIEKLGGQRKLKKLYVQHQKSVKGGENFFDAAIRLMRMKVEFDEGALALTPASGPVLFISNHPYGVLDGITLTWLATKIRPDTKVLANDVLCQAPEATANLLPVAFAPTREARETNVNSRLQAQAWLKDGHAIGILVELFATTLEFEIDQVQDQESQHHDTGHQHPSIGPIALHRIAAFLLGPRDGVADFASCSVLGRDLQRDDDVGDEQSE